ncbi:MAG: contractile injection system protein, VgrG/Pvc8 family [Lautropia sp.]|nr:contractile injection system protein, VgrG/Pvc8 family [Lautropia sp.]
MRPEFRLLANQTDITATIADRLISLRYTDEAGIDSDMLEIQLADHDPDKPIQIPSTGTELVLSLGYDGNLARIGTFVCDEIELSGWPGELTVRARATPFEASKGGMSQLQTQKRRSWPKGTLLADVVRKMAAEHGLKPVIAPEMAAIRLPHLDQLDESDMHFLVRIGGRYDAVIKPAGGCLVLAKKGQAKSATGQQLPSVILEAGEITSYRVSLTRRDESGMVVAYWHETKHARRKEVKVGQGEPVFRLKRYFPTAEMAMAAARAEYERRARRRATLSLTLPGRTDVVAEGRVVLAGIREGVDGQWIVSRAEHSLDASGLSTSIEAERANG